MKSGGIPQVPLGDDGGHHDLRGVVHLRADLGPSALLPSVEAADAGAGGGRDQALGGGQGVPHGEERDRSLCSCKMCGESTERFKILSCMWVCEWVTNLTDIFPHAWIL